MVKTAATPKKYTMAELRASKKSLFIRNNTGFLWTLHEKVGNGQAIDLELRPAGQPDSILYLSPAALDAPGIARNMVPKPNYPEGKITVSPDLEEEMIELMGVGAATSDKLLEQFHVDLVESANARAIDVKDQMSEILDRVDRKRVTPQGEQNAQSTVDEFISPAPYAVADGRVFNPATGEFSDSKAEVPETEASFDIKSIQITRPKTLPEN